MKQIEHDGEQWNVVAEGRVDEEKGLTFCHLSHPTRGRYQSNGFVPEQIADWVPSPQLEVPGADA